MGYDKVFKSGFTVLWLDIILKTLISNCDSAIPTAGKYLLFSSPQPAPRMV